jgi:enterochelin esterase family protein
VARTRLTVTGTPVGDVELTVVSPTGTRRAQPLPLVLVHDGPAYARKAHLLRAFREWYAAGLVPAHRMVLLEPGPRNERYAANPDYAEALTGHVLPTVRAAYGTAGEPAIVGSSLGALAAFQAEWLRPGTFGGLFLQSGSFFRKGLDDEEDFEFWERVTAFVASVRRARRRWTQARIVLTCGSDEGNLANNQQLAAALTRQGCDVTFTAVPGGRHDWPSWQAAFDPLLLTLLQGSDHPNDRAGEAHG